MVEAEELGREAPRERAVRPIEGFILATGILLAVACFLVFAKVGSVAAVQQSGIERGYKNRAVTCDLQLGLGLQESKECADPEIQPYRDPTVKPGTGSGATASRDTHKLVCALLAGAETPSVRVVYTDLCPTAKK